MENRPQTPLRIPYLSARLDRIRHGRPSPGAVQDGWSNPPSSHWPSVLGLFIGFPGRQFASRRRNTMDTREQMQKDTLGLTNRGISEAGFNWEDFWQHQLIRIKEIAEGEQAPKEDASGTLKSTRMKHEISADGISDR